MSLLPPARTRLTDIAEAADMKAGSLYYHFDSREALVEEALRATSACAAAAADGAGFSSVVTLGPCRPRHAPGSKLCRRIARNRADGSAHSCAAPDESQITLRMALALRPDARGLDRYPASVGHLD